MTTCYINTVSKSILFKPNRLRVGYLIHGRYNHTNHTSEKNQQNVGIVGCPFELGQQKSGVKLGPSSIRKAGLLYKINEFNDWINIKDYGDIEIVDTRLQDFDSCLKDNIPLPKNMRNYQSVVQTMNNLSTKVQEILKDKRLCITLGGDHSMAIGSIDGHLKTNKDVTIIWVDAHADLNTNITSGSGNIHGMPVALLAKELTPYWESLPGLEWMKPSLSLQDIVYIGLRAVDPVEKLISNEFNIKLYGMNDVDKYGIKSIIEMALNHIDPNCKKAIHLSFDIDALDPLEAPSTGTAVRGGLTLREGIYIVENIQRTGRLAAMDLVEVNPTIGSLIDIQKTLDAAIHLITAAVGTNRSGTPSKYITNIPT